jgi:hypothetical protein
MAPRRVQGHLPTARPRVEQELPHTDRHRAELLPTVGKARHLTGDLPAECRLMEGSHRVGQASQVGRTES